MSAAIEGQRAGCRTIKTTRAAAQHPANARLTQKSRCSTVIVEAAIADKKLAELAREPATADRDQSRSWPRRTARTDHRRAARQPSLRSRRRHGASISYHREIGALDESALPEAFIRRAPDKVAIAKALRAGQEVTGASLGNNQPRLIIRTS